MSIKGAKIEIKELNSIRVLSNDRIEPSEIDSVIGGHEYYGHHGCYDYVNKYVQDYIKYAQDHIKDYCGNRKEAKNEIPRLVLVGTQPQTTSAKGRSGIFY